MGVSGIFYAVTSILVSDVCVAENVDQKRIAGGSVKWVSSSGDKSPTDAMFRHWFHASNERCAKGNHSLALHASLLWT